MDTASFHRNLRIDRNGSREHEQAARAILTGISIEYLKKARGTLIAEAHIEVPASNEERSYEFESVVTDASGERVARATARWLVGPA